MIVHFLFYCGLSEVGHLWGLISPCLSASEVRVLYPQLLCEGELVNPRLRRFIFKMEILGVICKGWILYLYEITEGSSPSKATMRYYRV